MEIQNTLHKSKLIIGLFLHMHDKYRVEIEDYYVGSGDSCYLHHYYFANFKAAQKFIRGYDKEFYKITLFAQRGLKGTPCNLFTGSWITIEEEAKVAYIHDKYGFLDIVAVSGDGWYLRGKNLHNPDYVAITDDLEFLKKETWDRYIKSGGVLTFREVVNDLFKECYPNAASLQKEFPHSLFTYAGPDESSNRNKKVLIATFPTEDLFYARKNRIHISNKRHDFRDSRPLIAG